MSRPHGPLAAFSMLASCLVSVDELRNGYHKEVAVTAETRIDWICPLANQSPEQAPARLKRMLHDWRSRVSAQTMPPNPDYKPIE